MDHYEEIYGYEPDLEPSDMAPSGISPQHQEETALRTRTGKVFSLGQNRFQAVAYPQAVHYEEDGEWLEIDNTLVEHHAHDQRCLCNRQNGELHVELGGSQQGMIRLTDRENRQLSWHVLGAADVNPVITRNSAVAELRDVCEETEVCAQNEALYPALFEGVDLRAKVEGESFKDEVIFSQAQHVRPITFVLNAQNLAPALQADGGVRFCAENGKVPFSFPAPYALDAAGSFGAVAIELLPAAQANTWNLTCTLDAEWLSTAQFPVTLDPQVIIDRTNPYMADAYVADSFPPVKDDYLHLSLENSVYGVAKPYFKFLDAALPKLDSSCYITKAEFSVKTGAASGNVPVALYEVLESWAPETISLNNQPAISELATDSLNFSAAGTRYTFNITNMARKWYRDAADNHGLMLEVKDKSNFTLYSCKQTTSTANKPYLTVDYISLAGMEDSNAFEDQAVGRAGVGHVNLCNGHLVFEHADTACGGNLLPISVSHIYNACYAENVTTDARHMGVGWSTSLHQRLHRQTIADAAAAVEYYVLTDGDGTSHYFKLASGKWKDQSGLNLLLTVDTALNTAKITTKSDSYLLFDAPDADSASNPKPLKELGDACGNKATVVTNAQGKILTVQDGAGLVTRFLRDAQERLSAIVAPGDPVTGSCGFGYDALGRLISTWHLGADAGVTTCHYGYDDGNRLLSATDADGMTVSYEYDTLGAPCRVKKATISNGGVIGDSRLYEYGDGLTVITDLTAPNGRKLYYHFNDSGNVASVNDELGYGCFSSYGAGDLANQPQMVSKMQRTVCNLLRNHNFQDDTAWALSATAGSHLAKDSGADYLGTYGLKLTSIKGGECSAAQRVKAEPGKTYTFSFFAKRPDNADGSVKPIQLWSTAELGGWSQRSENLEDELASDEFSRVSWSFTVPRGAAAGEATLSIVGGEDAGEIYIDCVQLEEGPVANAYNLLANGDFSLNCDASPEAWVAQKSCEAGVDIVKPEYSGVKPAGLSANTLRISGNKTNKGFYQDVQVSGKTGDVYVLGGWSLGLSKPRAKTTKRLYELCAYFRTSDDKGWSNPAPIQWSDEWSRWQFAAGAVVAPCNYKYIRVSLDYYANVNHAEFDGLFLYREQFGRSYAYDGSGNVVSATDLAMRQFNAVYDSAHNLTSYARSTAAGTATTNLYYGADAAAAKKHLLTQMNSPTGVVQKYTYDEHGNALTSQVYTSAAAINGQTQYDTAGNYAVSTTDARGKKAFMDYDPATGLLRCATDAKGQQVRYAYDRLKRVTETSTVVDEKTYKNTYGYANDRLARVTHNTTDGTVSDALNDVNYHFTYDALGNPTAVKVGSQLLSANLYTETGDRLLKGVEYGNGGKVSYTHDDFKRVVGVRYDDDTADRFQYDFGANGQVARVRDNALGSEVYREYDASNRLMRVRRYGANGREYLSRVTYDKYNTVSRFMEQVGDKKHTYKYTYDKGNRPTLLTLDGNANQTIAYTYDALGRAATRTIKLGDAKKSFTTTYGYAAGAALPADKAAVLPTTALVSELAQGEQSWQYEYDDAGDVVKEKHRNIQVTYGYDGLGQLTRVNDPRLGYTWVYAYDQGGNVLAKTAYAYTTGALGKAIGVIAHKYGDANWKDKLTEYNGLPIAYDEIGNPTAYGGWTYHWAAGRQLQRMESEDTKAAFVYNADGLRVRKTVNGVVTDYTLNGKLISHLKRGDDELHFFYDAQGKASAAEYGGKLYGYAHNLQGDIVAILDPQGEVMVEYEYEAWGNPITVTGEMAETLGKLNPFRYRGYVWDEETGLYYLRSRYYCPRWGRFLNADMLLGRICKIMSHNGYAYCSNRVTGFVDTNGCEEKCCLSTWYNIDQYTVSKELYDQYNNFVNSYQNDASDPGFRLGVLPPVTLERGIKSATYTVKSVCQETASEIALKVNGYIGDGADALAQFCGSFLSGVAGRYLGISLDPNSISDKASVVLSVGTNAVEKLISPAKGHSHSVHRLTIERDSLILRKDIYWYEKCSKGTCNMEMLHTYRNSWMAR